MAKKSRKLKTRDIRVTASSYLWRKFENWWRTEGCTSRAEGIRTAMRIVTRK